MKSLNSIIALVIAIIVGGGIVWYMTGNSNESPSDYQQASSLDQTASSSDHTNGQADQQASQTQPQASASVQVQAGAAAQVPEPTAPSQPTTPTQSAAPAPQSFTVNGNDESADLTTITVPKGTPVSITFGADASGTYHGGLDFRSSVVSTGPIAPGSTKTVSFTAMQSFSFTPYWPSTDIAKPYTIRIIID